MELQEAFTMRIDYLGQVNPIKVNENGEVCMNDMALYFPNKSLKEWLNNNNTKDFIIVMEKYLNTSDPSDLKGGDYTLLERSDFGSRGGIPKGLKSIRAKRGKYDGGTYANKILALKFAMWLSPEFELKVLLEYENGTQQKKNWNIKRILASFNYKLMSKAVEGDHAEPKFYHYSNEAIMLNKIVFGKHEKTIRDNATEQELDLIAKLEGHNATLIGIGMDFQDRKDKLKLLINNDLKLLSPIEN